MTDSDSDTELLTNNVFASQNDSTVVSARGPNVNVSNITGISFRDRVLSSTMQMPRNYEWQRGLQLNYDQRSVSYRRETSPMSIASACDARQKYWNNSSYQSRGMSPQRSVYNGRGVSPMSTRSIDSNVSAIDIAMAIKNNQFNNHDMKIISDAFKKYRKYKARKKIEKRRNRRLLLKGYIRKSGYDSELASESSISSDDNRSTRTMNYKSNMSSSRSTKTDIADIRKTMKESNIFTDCTDYLRQKRMHSVLATEHISSKASVSSFRNMTEIPTRVMPAQAINTTQRLPSMTQRDRFRNRGMLLSERFNRSVAASSIPEHIVVPHTGSNKQQTKSMYDDHHVAAKSSEDLISVEEIFSEVQKNHSTVNQRKRSVDSDDDPTLQNKANKWQRVASPCKNMTGAYKQPTIEKSASQDFEFAKPVFPIRKNANSKIKEKLIPKSANMNTTEMLITKSAAPLVQTSSKQTNLGSQLQTLDENEEIDSDDNAEKLAVTQNTTDVSMQPSFKKRKLFSQTMEVTESKNTDILAPNSPQDIYSDIYKERNKARKLVTAQYCLTRDVQKDQNNLLNLIHKIVPAERMNVTNHTNKTVAQMNKSAETDKWDITSFISNNNNDNVSDTFTDEENIIAQKSQVSSPKAPNNIRTQPPKEIVAQKVLIEKNGSETPKNKVQKSFKLFWDSDSDAELVSLSLKSNAKPHQDKDCKEKHFTDNKKQPEVLKSMFRGFPSIFQSNKQTLGNNTLLNNTTESISKVNNTSRSFKLYSHRNTKPNVKIPEKMNEYAKPHLEPQIGTTSQIKSRPDLDDSLLETNKEQKNKSNVKEKPEVSKTPKRKRKNNKENDFISPKVVRNKDDSQNNKSHKINEPGNTVTNQRATAKCKPQDNKLTTKENKIKDKNKSNATNQENDGKQNARKKKDEIKNSVKSLDNKKSDATSKQNKILASNKVKEKIEPATNKKANISTVDLVNDNNVSIRPVRSCRNSKQNVTINATKSNDSNSRSLRSRDVSLTSLDNLPLDTKSVQNKKTKIQKKEQSVLSDFSISLEQDKINNKKPVSNLNTRVLRTRELDISDVSFSLTHNKDSPLPKRSTRNSARARNGSTLTPCILKKSLRSKK